MGLFSFLKEEGPDWVKLPQPDDSIDFFQTIKVESEKYWNDTSPNPSLYGFQIQSNTKWNQGLSDSEIRLFEKTIGIEFPVSLKNFYTVMNGLDKPGVKFLGKQVQPDFRPIFYSFPADLALIQEMTSWICSENGIEKDEVSQKGISRLFPIYLHRFMLTDITGNPILSMYGQDIIYYSDSLSKFLGHEIFDNIFNASDFDSDPNSRQEVKFWLD